MRTNPVWLQISLSLAAAVCAANLSRAQSTTFTYQGRLNDNGAPANGVYDLRFTVYDAATNGRAVSGDVTNATTGISNGLFTVTLDFGTGVFTGADRWLDIAVGTNGDRSLTTLSPRQALLPAPYAIYSANAGAATTATVANGVTANAIAGAGVQDSTLTAGKIANGQVVKSLNGLSDAVTLAAGANVTITPSGNTLTLAASPASGWSLVGNAGTTGANFMGTSDEQPLELKVNGTRALRLEPNTNGAPNIIGGAVVNTVGPGVVGAFIGGGGSTSYLGHAYTNAILADFGTIGGGLDNTVAAFLSTIGGGYFNLIQAYAIESAIGGGYFNTIEGPLQWGTIGGGSGNRIAGFAEGATIAGGVNNGVGFNARRSIIGGGTANVIATNAYESTIGGGSQNTAESNEATVGGGQFNHARGSSSTIGGGYDNTVTAGAGTIGGGARNRATNDYSVIAGGEYNTAGSDHTTVGGGYLNYALGSSSTVGGGCNNVASGGAATVAGGSLNQTIGYAATIGGGRNNSMGNYNDDCVIGGGNGNHMDSVYVFSDQGSYNTIGGGNNNYTHGYGATIAGGVDNSASGYVFGPSYFSSVGGGASNTAYNGGAVPGGYLNTASGVMSFAAGYRAKAVNTGAFVWADNTAADFSSSADNQFCIRASGGVRLSDSTPSISFGNTTRQVLNLWGTTYGIGIQDFVQYSRTGGGFAWFLNGSHSDTPYNSGGGTTLMTLDNGGLTVRGTFVSSSDRNAKENFAPVDIRAVLDKVAALLLSQWNFKLDGSSRHIGPMAQDFYAAFGVGPDDRHIATVDADGVALAAIQGLNQKVEEKDAQITELKERLSRLEALVNKSTRTQEQPMRTNLLKVAPCGRTPIPRQRPIHADQPEGTTIAY